MFVLIITSCLATGGDCYPHMEAQDLGEIECRNRSQAIAAKWGDEHPKRQVTRITCAPKQRIGFYIGRNEA